MPDDKSSESNRRWAWEKASDIVMRYAVQDGYSMRRELEVCTHLADLLLRWIEQGASVETSSLPVRKHDTEGGDGDRPSNVPERRRQH